MARSSGGSDDDRRPTSEERLREARQRFLPGSGSDDRVDSDSLFEEGGIGGTVAYSDSVEVEAEGGVSRDALSTERFPSYQPSDLLGGSPRRLPSFPWGWLVVGVLAAGGLVYDYFTEAKRDESGAVIEAGEVTHDALQVGDCLLLPEGVTLDVDFDYESLGAVPCVEAHDMEVFASVEYPNTEYPGQDALLEFGDESCVPVYEEFTGIAYEHEMLFDYLVSVPDETAWSNGSHSIRCLLTSLDGQRLTGSQQDEGLVVRTGIEVSSCYTYVETDRSFGFKPIDCDRPHDAEYYAVVDVRNQGREQFPGEQYLYELGDSYCYHEFSAYVGQNWEFGVTPDYEILVPIEEGWADGDRLVQCLLVEPQGGTLSRSYADDG